MTNKANQTPSHWVYNDMTTEASENLVSSDLIYPFAASPSTFNTYLDTNSPRFIQTSPYHVYSNEKPAPPPYPPHLSTVMPIRTRSPLVQPRRFTANPHTAPPTTAPPPAPSSLKLTRKNPPFYALVKAADSSAELYARPPSDHFYFKISDGKTEFI